MRKLIAIILAMVMVIGLLPVMSYANDVGMKDGFTYIVLAPGNYTNNGMWQIETDTDPALKFMVGAKATTPDIKNPAVTKIGLPKEGTYKVMALSKDFTTNPGVRYYEVQIGDKKFTMGNHGNQGWFWQSENFTTLAGEYDLKVVDVKGNYARNAMIVVTDDLSFNPEVTVENINALAQYQYKEGDIKAQAGVSLEGRPDTDIAVRLNGNWMSFDVPPVIMNGRTMVPFRAIFEALGCTVSWDAETRTAKGMRNGRTVELTIDSKVARLGDQYQTLDQEAVIESGRTLVPLRFVSEALGAEVQWIADSRVVVILATVPDETVMFTQHSFSDVGSWIMEANAEGAFNQLAVRGLIPVSGAGAALEDADTSSAVPAVAEFDLAQGGEYKIWARSRDFAENQQGDRFFQVSLNDGGILPHKFGTHGKTGYAWASGDTVTLPAGPNTLYVHDTSGFYARFDAILLTKDMNFVPSENYETLTKIVMPFKKDFDTTPAFPVYAKEQAQPLDSVAIENEHTKVVFYKVPTSKGQVVQNEIYAKHNGQWVKTNGRDEALGYLVMSAIEASNSVSQDLYGLKAKYEFEGKVYGGLTTNPYAAGVGTWFVPVDYTANGSTVTLNFGTTDVGTMTATWTLDENAEPLVSIDTTFAKEGFYSVGASEGGEFAADEVEFSLAPFRVQYKRFPDEPELMNEQYLFTPMGTYTLYENNKYSAEPVTKGVVADPSWIPLRWVYKENCMLGITMKSNTNMCRGAIFAPVMGNADSKMAAGDTYNLRFRVVSKVSDWFENYKEISQELFDVTDYRQNYEVSLNEVIFNTRELMLDDVYGGWDIYDKAHYNMEGKSATSVANSMIAMQDYLLSEDEDMLTRRAIPTLANALTRGSIHFNRTGLTGGGEYWTKKTEPDSIGTPVSGFNANVVGGMYEMTRGAVPFLHTYTLNKGRQSVTNSYGSIASFSNDIAMYKYTGDKKHLDAAIEKADKYLEEQVYGESRTQPDWSSFIYISYYPNLASLIDIYEVTNNKKYLDAAVDVARWMSTGLWVPGVDGTRKTDPLMVNDQVINNLHYGKEDSPTFWWAGLKQFRIGRTEDLKDTDANNENIISRIREVEGWIPSRVGLGVEQASTFSHSSNIIMQSFVGDFMKLTAYTGDEYFATIARNATIGRYRSYDGYYRNNFMTYQMEMDYPKDGPDYTGIYWHHLPPFLAMIEDFLIGQTMAWSGNNIHFPSLRQQGYAYFNSNQYGHEPGVFYGEKEMWPWLAEGVVSTDNIQIDWMAARKDGVMGVALMNESANDITTNVTLGDKVPGGATFSGTADLYDKNGKIGTVNVVNGVFNVNVPAKALTAVIIKLGTVKAPAFAKFDYSDTSAEIGGTVSNHENGKGYTLQMSPNEYYAYVYVTDKTPSYDESVTDAYAPKYQPSATPYVTSLTITYDIGGGAKKTETTSVYPFEFIIKVDDVDKEFNYKLTATMSDGTTADRGGATLMTKAVSEKKGIKYEEPKAPAKPNTPVSSSSATDAANAMKFDAFKLKYTAQGSDGKGLRFVMKLSDIPFEVNGENVIGLVVKGKITDEGKEDVPFESTIVAYEPRNTDMCVLTVARTAETSTGYSSTTEAGNTHKWDLQICPIK